MKEGAIETSITKVVVQGPARAGKTSVKDLILCQIYKSDTSTGCAESPEISVGKFEVSCYGRQGELFKWELVGDESMIKKLADEIRTVIYKTEVTEVHVPTEDVLQPSVFDKQHASKKRFVEDQRHYTASHTASGQKVFETQTKREVNPINSSTQKLSKLISEAKSKGIPLSLYKEWLYTTDSGGQIQYQQLLHAFIPFTSVLMLVINLANDLSEQSSAILQSKDGRYPVSDYTPSVETLLRRLTLMVNSSGHFNKYLSKVIVQLPEEFKIIAIATHRDEYDERVSKGDQVESIEKKEQKLTQVFQSMKEKLSYANPSGKILSEVDGRKAKTGEFDDPVMQEIREELRENSFKVKIPIRWYALDILLRKEVHGGCGVLPYQQCEAIGMELGFWYGVRLT